MVSSYFYITLCRLHDGCLLAADPSLHLWLCTSATRVRGLRFQGAAHQRVDESATGPTRAARGRACDGRGDAANGRRARLAYDAAHGQPLITYPHRTILVACTDNLMTSRKTQIARDLVATVTAAEGGAELLTILPCGAEKPTCPSRFTLFSWLTLLTLLEQAAHHHQHVACQTKEGRPVSTTKLRAQSTTPARWLQGVCGARIQRTGGTTIAQACPCLGLRRHHHHLRRHQHLHRHHHLRRHCHRHLPHIPGFPGGPGPSVPS